MKTRRSGATMPADPREVAMTDIDVHGPIDFVLIEFPGDRPTGGTAQALLDLVDAGLVRVYDLVIVRKDADGTVSGVAIDESLDGRLGGFTAFDGVQTGLLGDEDVREAAEAMQAGTIAALIVYENAWAVPFVAAAREAGGELVASARIPAQDVMDALDELESQH
jgi:hypothetical protein